MRGGGNELKEGIRAGGGGEMGKLERMEVEVWVGGGEWEEMVKLEDGRVSTTGS